MSDNDNLPVDGGTGTATPSDRADANLSDDLDFEGQDQPASSDPVEAWSEADAEPAAGDSAQEAEEPEAREGGAEGEEQPAANAPMADDAAKVRLASGEEISVAEARKGYMRQADYSIKTSQLAEGRRGLEAQAQLVTRAVENLASFLRENLPAAPDPALLYSDPQAHYRQKAMHDAALAQVEKVMSMAAEPKGAVAEMTQAQQQETLAAENARLAERFPETTRPDGRDSFFRDAFAAARDLGFGDKDWANVTDHRLFALARYAKLGMDAEKARAVAQRKVEGKPPVTPPRRQAAPSGDQRAYQQAKNRFAQTGSFDDAMALDF